MTQTRLSIAPLMALVRLHRMALSIAAVLVLLYALAGFFLVPRIARSQIESYVTEQLHRRVSIGEIRFNPFVLDASVHDLRLEEADGAALVSFRHLYVNAQLASLWQRAVVLREVQLSAPNIDLVIEKDGTVNLAHLVPPSTEPRADAGPPPRVRIGTLAVREGRIGVADYTRGKPFTAEVTPIRFTLSDFRTDVGYENAYAFSGATSAGEQLEWAGAFTVQPLGSTGRFKVGGLRAATVDDYLYESLPFKLASGTASVAGEYRFALHPELALDIMLPAAEILDLSIAERSGITEAPLVVPRLELQQVAFSYARREVTVRSIAVTGARLAANLEPDGSLNLMRLVMNERRDEQQPQTDSDKPAATDPARDAADASPSDWSIRADTIQLVDGSVLVEDQTVSPAAKLALAPVQLTVSDWSADPAHPLRLDADVSINETGRLLGQGTLQLQPLTARMSIELKTFPLPVIQPYLARTTAMTLHTGNVSLQGDVTYAAEPRNAAPMTFKGAVQVADLRTTDQLVNENFVKWRSLEIGGIDFSLHPSRLTIDRIVAREPYARVVIAPDRALNVTQVLNPQGKQQEAPELRKPAAKEKNAFPMRIRTVRFIDGSANFADYSIEPSFATGILDLNGSVVGLSSNASSRAKVELQGKVDRYAPVDITGEVNLLAASVYTDLAMNFRNMELTTFNPYSGKFAGYNISKGKLSTELHYKVEQRKLEAAHHIVLDNLEFGERTDSRDAAPIPVKLAVALLKDRNGVIDVNLPVSGTLDDPQFRLGPIIWKAVLGLLTKIVTSPFAAIGALIGGGDELSYVEFAPGTAALSATEAGKLSKLAGALVERPQLRLSVPLTVATAADGDALARASLAATLPHEASEDLSDERAKRKRVALLESTYARLAGSRIEYPAELGTGANADPDAQLRFLDQALLARLQPDDTALASLARERARVVQDALLANPELDPERVFITADRTEGKSEAGAVRMEMRLE